MRTQLIAALIAVLAIGFGGAVRAQGTLCRGQISMGGLYEQRLGGGYFEYVVGLHNQSSTTLQWTLQVSGMRNTVSADRPTIAGTLKPGARENVGFAKGGCFRLEDLRLMYDGENPYSFPALKLTDWRP